MSKYTYRYLSLLPWQISALEAWFEAMAARGLQLEKVGLLFAKFRRGKPQSVRYRVDVFDLDDQFAQERLTIYEQTGWNHLGSYTNLIQIFTASEDTAIPEIHTDPQEQAYTIKRLYKSLIGNAAIFALLTCSILFFEILPTTRLSHAQLLLNDRLFFVLGALIAYCIILLRNIRGLIYVTRLVKQLKTGIFPSDKVRYTSQIRRGYAGTIIHLLALFSLLLAGRSVFSSQFTVGKYADVPAGNLPVVRLAEIHHQPELTPLDSIDTITSSNLFRDYYQQSSSFLVPQQYELQERAAIKGQTVQINCDTYVCRTPRLAEWLFQLLVEQQNIQDISTQLITDHSGFNSLWLGASATLQVIIVQQNNAVLYTMYDGSEAPTIIINLMRLQLDELMI